MPKLIFLGAAGTVTGSKYLVEAANKRLLIDCGIFQGTPELTDRNYKPLSIDPKTFNYVVLTHAHLDHPGLHALKLMPRTGAFDVSPEFHIDSYDAGHILGSSSLVLTINEAGKKTIVVFSGDIGRYDQPILNDPATPPVNADVLLCE